MTFVNSFYHKYKVAKIIRYLNKDKQNLEIKISSAHINNWSKTSNIFNIKEFGLKWNSFVLASIELTLRFPST